MESACHQCGQIKKIAAKGLCSRCYEQAKPPIVCIDCGQQRRGHKKLDGGSVCATCWGRRNQMECSQCGRLRPRANRASQPPVCSACWTKNRPLIDCAGCGAPRRRPGGIDAPGQQICTRCAQRRRGRITCVGCGQSRYPHQPTGDGHLCSACSAKQRAPEVCGGCGRVRLVVARGDDGSARCHRCWAATHRAPCADCGRDRKIVTRTASGLPLCGSCNPLRGGPVPCGACGREGIHPTRDAQGRPQCAPCWRHQRLPCSGCGEVALVALRWLAGPVCAGCVDDALAAPQRCATCGKLRPNVASAGAAAQCPDCADLRFDYECAGCGRFTRPLQRGQCPSCRLVAALRVAVPDGVAEELTEFVEEALLTNAGRGLRILRAPRTAALLRGILSGAHTASGRRPVTVALSPRRFAAKPGTGITAQTGGDDEADLLAELRTALAVTGILPREPSLTHYQQRVDELVGAVPDPARLVVRRYVRWAVTRSLQAQVDAGATITNGLVRWPLQRARIAALFTTAVCEKGLSLAEVSQSHLDAWLSELPSHRTALRAFVQWATSHRYLDARLEVPAPVIRERRTAMDDVDRLQLARQLLRERDEDPPARLAAVLVLLFGQLVTRLCLLKLTAITVDDDGRVSIALSDTPLRLREPLAGLALQVADSARDQGSAWLFPSSQGNRPLSADRLRERLAQLGLTRVLEARNGALGALATQLPPALIADQLGLSIAAAAGWSKAVGAARSDYAALRTPVTR
jgi:hypothetical protein